MHGSQRGQVGLTVILIMVVVASVAMSAASRSSQELVLTRQSQEAYRTFSAAEAAVENILSQGEDYLLTNPAGNFSLDDPNDQDRVLANVDYTVDSRDYIETSLLEGSTAEMRLAQSGSTHTCTDLRILWGEEGEACGGNNEPASLIITVTDTNAATPINRTVSLAGCDRGDGFLLAGVGSGGWPLEYSLPVASTETSVKITAAYEDTRIRVEARNGGAACDIDSQQFIIQSLAQNAEGRESKGIEVTRTRNATPAIFDSTIFSGSTIIK